MTLDMRDERRSLAITRGLCFATVVCHDFQLSDTLSTITVTREYAQSFLFWSVRAGDCNEKLEKGKMISMLVYYKQYLKWLQCKTLERCEGKKEQKKYVYLQTLTRYRRIMVYTCICKIADIIMRALNLRSNSSPLLH